MAVIINGREIANRIRAEVSGSVKRFQDYHKFAPKLSVILVGDDPASQVYVRNKEKAASEVGIVSEVHRFPLSVKENQLIDVIRQFNRDRSVHGILVQLPLPVGINSTKVLENIEPLKDVDGLHPLNLGKLLKGENPFFTPCTPLGIIELILSTGVELAGTEAVVVGRSNIVGKPVSILLLQKNATVTICHSKTKDLQSVCQRADILVAAVGSPALITGEMIKPGAVVIDVGVNRVGERLVGDVDFSSAVERAGYITPVPGGVGPMTIAFLLKNVLRAAELSVGK